MSELKDIANECIQKEIGGTILHCSEWPSKSLQIINSGEGVEKKGPSYTVGGNANVSHYGER